MQLFTEYIQPATNWLQLNPEWALFITFLISFAESLAIIGSIVPGSITMTGIGILAGSGIMRVDLTLLAATLGAIVGDGTSYLLGSIYSERLVTIWPFKRYPQLLDYGKEYFARHGGKSVLIGRFFGPLRSIIPVIAGMMHMSHWRFYLANIISAFFWSLLYILPGVLLGAASTELPPESAGQFLVMVLSLLISIWLASLFIKWLLIKLNQFLNSSLDSLWQRAVKHEKLAKFFKSITPAHEKNHYATAGLFIILSTVTVLFFVLASLVFEQSHIDLLNAPIHFVIQSLRNETIDSIFIAITQIASPIALAAVSFLTLVLALYTRQSRLLIYFSSMLLWTVLCLLATHFLIFSPRPAGILIIQLTSSFPSSNLTYATALFTSFLLYLNQNTKLKFRSSLNITTVAALLLIGFGQLLLGDYWATDILGAYLLGLLICLLHYLFYRKTSPKSLINDPIVVVYFCVLLAGSLTSLALNHAKIYKRHQPFITQYTVTQQIWWTQTKPLLPIYQRNRFGRPISLFNMQYAGSLELFTSTLIKAGWSIHDESFTKALMKHLSGYKTYREFPLMAELYLNRKPSLVMTYRLVKHGPTLILRLWRSNYYLKDGQQRIWIGSVHTRAPLKPQNRYIPGALTPLTYIQKALNKQFVERIILLNINTHKELALKVFPTLLLIREIAPVEE